MLGLRFCARAFSSCGERGPLFIAVRGPLTIMASLVGSTGSRRAGSVVVAHGPSHSAACGIFPDQGSNPCPLHWQADSQQLHHQGSPLSSFFKIIFSFFCSPWVIPLLCLPVHWSVPLNHPIYWICFSFLCIFNFSYCIFKLCLVFLFSFKLFVKLLTVFIHSSPEFVEHLYDHYLDLFIR